jgi:hypothetical protein
MRTSERLSYCAELSQSLYTLYLDLDLLGIEDSASRDALSMQIIDSVRRVEYVNLIRGKSLTLESVANPDEDHFNPIKYASALANSGNLDEASWLVFLISHFNKNSKDGWNTVRKIYNMSGAEIFSWSMVSSNFGYADDWLKNNYEKLNINFGNHRKYESKRISSNNSVIDIFKSYVDMILDFGSHNYFYSSIYKESEFDRAVNFALLYEKMHSVKRFGRTAKFDHVCLLGKLGIFDGEPSHCFLKGATGPATGVNVLVNGDPNISVEQAHADKVLHELAKRLPIKSFKMQILEDSICNWQKNPKVYKKFNL